MTQLEKDTDIVMNILYMFKTEEEHKHVRESRGNGEKNKSPNQVNRDEKYNIIPEMKNAQEGINSRITEAEEWTGDQEDRVVEITATEENEQKRMKRNEDSLTGLWNNMK